MILQRIGVKEISLKSIAGASKGNFRYRRVGGSFHCDGRVD